MSKKNERIENERRVDGEFHYAVIEKRPLDGLCWVVKRRADDEYVENMGLPITRENVREIIEHTVKSLDEQARHWIEHTQAPNQELREAAAESEADFNTARTIIRRMLTAWRTQPARVIADERNRYALWLEEHPIKTRVTAALSNNPQVSEGSEAAGWQPIETAPKGNADLLLLCGSAGVGYWDKHMQKFRDHYGETCSPTHWMAIPESPATTSNPIPEGEGP